MKYNTMHYRNQNEKDLSFVSIMSSDLAYINLGILLYFILSYDDFEINWKYYSFIIVSL